jgi:hypothetical protein
MSKVDAMRALREARRAAASAGPAAAPQRASARAAAPQRPRPGAGDSTAPAPGAAELCGHRNMGGRSCTRELDHVKQGTKNHRYG